MGGSAIQRAASRAGCGSPALCVQELAEEVVRQVAKMLIYCTNVLSDIMISGSAVDANSEI